MSIILAKILSIYFLGVGISFLWNPRHLRGVYELMMRSDLALFLGSLMALLFGAVIVSLHNVWIFGWPVAITLIGWWSIIKGLSIMICPKSIKIFSFMLDKGECFYRSIGLLLTLLGSFFFYWGWMF